MNLNRVFLVGNLTRDPEQKALPSGITVTTFGMATNRVFRDRDGNRQESTEFHNVVVFGRQAETSGQYLKRGQLALIEGRLQTRSWEQDGQKKYRTEVIADRVQFGPKAGGGGYSSDSSEGVARQNPQSAQPPSIQYPEEEINPDDIPF
jgi:single-strand DNA-binding protein